MGRLMGAYDSDELDRPDLNKCPDCGCYFATEECPLCGKICPEEMRAGNRAAVKKPKRKKNGNYTGRVQFIPWYYSWWFILIMMYLMPIAGIILFFTSPHSKKSKIIAASVVVGIYVLLGTLSVGFGLIGSLFEKPLINDDISRAEYVELCQPMSVEDFYRDAYHEGNYVTMELTVVKTVPSGDGNYYVCADTDEGTLRILLLDCQPDQKTNYLAGDRIRVYGECAGAFEHYENGWQGEELPCLYMAYSDLIG